MEIFLPIIICHIFRLVSCVQNKVILHKNRTVKRLIWRFCYLDVANITKLFRKTILSVCLDEYFNEKHMTLTFIKTPHYSTSKDFSLSILSIAAAGECPMKIYFFTSGLVKRIHS